MARKKTKQKWCGVGLGVLGLQVELVILPRATVLEMPQEQAGGPTPAAAARGTQDQGQDGEQGGGKRGKGWREERRGEGSTVRGGFSVKPRGRPSGGGVGCQVGTKGNGAICLPRHLPVATQPAVD